MPKPSIPLSWGGPFEWPRVREWFDAIYPVGSEGRYIVEVIDDVVTTGHGSDLAATLAETDLYISSVPVCEPPSELIAVRGPKGIHASRNGFVQIVHLTVTGKNDLVERPLDEALPLFWAFTREKFGLVR